MANAPGVVITGGDFQALGVLRSLGRKGIPVIVLDSDHGICRYSKYKSRFIKSPPTTEGQGYVDFLLKLAASEGLEGWGIYANSDNAVSVLSRNKKSLENIYRVPTPDWNVIEKVYIKKNTYKIAEQHSIPIAKTYVQTTLDDLIEENLEYPLVIKPSIRDNFYNKVKIKAFRVNNREELVKTYTYVSSIIDTDEIVVQEFIPGGPHNLYSFGSFFKDGRSVNSIMGRRARQHPMDFGHASTYAELVNIPEMKALAEKFLSVIGYYGISEVEFMQDPRSGEFKMIEVNPRVWGWHSLAIGAGVDLPYLQYLDMIGESLPTIEPPVANLKWVRLATDCPTVFLEILKKRMTLGGYLKSMSGKKEFAVFSWDDPFPFWVELLMLPYLWKKRGF